MRALFAMAAVAAGLAAGQAAAQTIDLTPPPDAVARGLNELNNRRARVEILPQEDLAAMCNAGLAVGEAERGNIAFGCALQGPLRMVIYISRNLDADGFYQTFIYELAVVGGWRPGVVATN